MSSACNKKKKHVLAHHPARPVRAASGFDYPTSLVGKSSWLGSDGKPVSVYYDPATGANGLKAAQYVLGKIDALMSYLDGIFGVRGLGGNVIVAPLSPQGNGDGGAYHYGCGFGAAGGDWYADSSPDPVMTFGLVMAEVCESYMGLQKKGWDCGGSGGEGLSRFLAEIVSGGPSGSLIGFASGPSWDGADWISRDQGTDGDYPSIGCAILYCWWMLSKGYTVAQIVQAGEPDVSLASNFAVLTGKPRAQAFADFKAAVAAAGGPTSDNPFGVPTPPWQGAPVPPPQPPPGPPTPPPAPAALFEFDSKHLRAGRSYTITPPVDVPADHYGWVKLPKKPAVESGESLAPLALLSDLLKLYADVRAHKGSDVLVADLAKIAADLGLAG
jgi:hypothetical protein